MGWSGEKYGYSPVESEVEKSPLKEKLALLISQHKQGIGNSFYGGMENLAHELVRENDILRQAMGNHADSYENGRKSAAEEIIQFIVDQGTIECGKDDPYFVVADDLVILREKFGLEI